MAIHGARDDGALREVIEAVCGTSTFREFLATHPAGGGHHAGYLVGGDECAAAGAQLTGSGHPAVQAPTLPVATVAFFAATVEIGVATEIVGIAEAARGLVAQLQSGAF